jgi:predicted GIY-YIG superfamily endonuclease
MLQKSTQRQCGCGEFTYDTETREVVSQRLFGFNYRGVPHDAWHVYVLRLDEKTTFGPNGQIIYGGETYYVGSTRNLRNRMEAHRHGMTPTTAGTNPRLIFVHPFPSQELAEEAEKALQSMHSQMPQNMEFVRTMQVFEDVAKELDYRRR